MRWLSRASYLSNCILLRAAAVRFACSSPKGVSVDSSLSPWTSRQRDIRYIQQVPSSRTGTRSICAHHTVNGQSPLR